MESWGLGQTRQRLSGGDLDPWAAGMGSQGQGVCSSRAVGGPWGMWGLTQRWSIRGHCTWGPEHELWL